MSGWWSPGHGIWITHADENGVPQSASIIVEPCALDESAKTRPPDDSEPWEHGLAQWVYDDGATLLCTPCGRARAAEEAREARMRRLPPQHRQWLEARGIHDWPVKEKAR